MKYERVGLLLPQTDELPLDHDLRDSLEVALGQAEETYKQLEVSAERKVKITEAWRNGEDADLSVEGVDEFDLEVKRSSLKLWKQELIAREDIDPEIKQLYRWKVNEHIANVNMVLASSRGETANFRRWNEFIYGTPNEDIYRAALDWVANDADALLAAQAALEPTDRQPAVITAAERVKGLLQGKRGYRELLAPDEQTFEAVRADHMSKTGYYGLLLAGVDIPEGGKINNEIGDPMLKQLLRNIQSPKEIVDAAGASWSVSSKGLERPAKYDMPVKRFVGLAAGHEGSHEIERINGSRGPLALAAEGFDRHEVGNEGRGVIREQVPYETFDEFGKIVRWRDIMRRHISISFAAGIGEDRPATSSETYAFMNAIDMMYQSKLTGDDETKTIEAAQKKTDTLLLRSLKGTDGKGGAYYKDEVYLEGHVAGWLTAALRGPNAISEGDLAKSDINNARHIRAMQHVGLLPRGE